jgi:hypothetical protein
VCFATARLDNAGLNRDAKRAAHADARYNPVARADARGQARLGEAGSHQPSFDMRAAEQHRDKALTGTRHRVCHFEAAAQARVARTSRPPPAATSLARAPYIPNCLWAMPSSLTNASTPPGSTTHTCTLDTVATFVWCYNMLHYAGSNTAHRDLRQCDGTTDSTDSAWAHLVRVRLSRASQLRPFEPRSA